MLPIGSIVERLHENYGEPALPPAIGPFEHILWENACYLLPDSRRLEVFTALQQQVGLTAAAIASAPDAVLKALAQRGGMRPETRVFRWREIARITLSQFGGDLNTILCLPYAAAKRALKQFPSIGDPGAEKILLLCGMPAGLPLDSNGLRVLLRVGYGRAQKAYGAMYRSVQDDLRPDLPTDASTLSLAHRLLREHGKMLCKEKAPRCSHCPIRKGCDYAAQRPAEPTASGSAVHLS